MNNESRYRGALKHMRNPGTLPLERERSALTVHVFEDVEDGEDLSVVGHQGFSHRVAGHHQMLQNFQGGADHLAVPRVQGIWKAKIVSRSKSKKAIKVGPTLECRFSRKKLEFDQTVFFLSPKRRARPRKSLLKAMTQLSLTTKSAHVKVEFYCFLLFCFFLRL